MKTSYYRADIDGLRAFAVLSVILFHLDFSVFSGGFVGVDIFFVISGFLITRLIRNEVVEKKSFDFSNFYARRARRLFPSLVFTLFLSFLAAYMLFAPQHFERFGGSLLHTVMSISNIYFWSESDYFNTSSEFKPLLHTWSLSVEEQFYMVWPLVTVFLLRKQTKYIAPLLFAAVGLLSLCLNQIFADDSESIFFLAPFRVFEFSIGAIVVWLIEFQPKKNFVLELLLLIGLAMIAYPVFIYTKDIVFPSYNALLPCIGTAVIIYSGTARYCSKLLSNRLAVNIGLISYSLYLVHWPIIVFYKYWKISEFSEIDKYMIILVSLILAVFMWRFIEQPFRRGNLLKDYSKGGIGFVCALIALVFVLPAANVWANNGWVARFPKDLVGQLGFKSDHFHKYVWARYFELERGFSNNGKAKILVIGDSMAADFVNILAESKSLEKFDLVTMPILDGCKSVFPMPEDIYRKFKKKKAEICIKKHEEIMKSDLLNHVDTVVLASSWQDWNVDFIKSTVSFLMKRGAKQVAIVGKKHQSMNGIKFIAKYALRKGASNVRTPLPEDTYKINNKIKQLNPDAMFINLLDYFCNNDGCQRVTDKGNIIIYDMAHFSPKGAEYVGGKTKSSKWMSSLVNTIN